jgi:hypothetical protein
VADYTVTLSAELDQVLLRYVAQLNQRRGVGDPVVTAVAVLTRLVTPKLSSLVRDRRERGETAFRVSFDTATAEEKAAALEALGLEVVNGEVVKKR